MFRFINKIKAYTVSAIMVCVIVSGACVPAMASEEKAESHIITGFADFDISDHYLYFPAEERPSEEALSEEMPEELGVYLDGSEEPVAIEVDWYEICGDYDEGRYYYYQFSPEWDETLYEIADGIDVWTDAPYIGVFFDEDPNEVVLSASSVNGYRNEVAVYHYLIDTMKVNSGVASGILANIERESAFRTSASYKEANGLTSYGICQWNGERLDALKAYAGDDFTTLNGQLDYLYYELQHTEKSAWNNIKIWSNSATGAYNTAYNWAKYFERCTSSEFVTRANLAKNTYWPEYGSAGTSGSTSGSWVKDGDHWKYKDSSGNYVKNKWVKSKGEWYYIKPNGYMAANEWAEDSIGWCFMDADGKITRSKWRKSNGEWYYLKVNGYMAVNDWEKDSEGWCRLGADGRIVKGTWLKNNARWYYLKPNGYMAANEWAKDSGGWYWMNEDGIFISSVWKKINGEWYFFKANGYMAANEWAKDSNGWMYMDANGKITKNKWVKSGSYWYYLKANGYMATGTVTINGKTYKFDSSGRWIS